MNYISASFSDRSGQTVVRRRILDGERLVLTQNQTELELELPPTEITIDGRRVAQREDVARGRHIVQVGGTQFEVCLAAQTLFVFRTAPIERDWFPESACERDLTKFLAQSQRAVAA